MKKVNTEEINDGMILAAPVSGASGNTLLGKGIELKSALIPRLLSWGITHVFVEVMGESSEAIPVVQNKEAFENNVSLQYIFDGRRVSEPMQRIYKVICNHRGLEHEPH